MEVTIYPDITVDISGNEKNVYDFLTSIALRFSESALYHKSLGFDATAKAYTRTSDKLIAARDTLENPYK